VNVMSARGVIPASSGFAVRWFGGFAVRLLGRFAVVLLSAREAAAGPAGGDAPAIGRVPSHDAGTGAGADLLTVSVSAREGYTLVSLDGEGDVTVRERLRAALTAEVAAGTPHLVVDLTGLAYIDASCVQVLWRVSRVAEGTGGRLGLAAPQPLVARVMELWGARQVIGVHDSVAEAVIAAAG
jgi:anti-anti-sigma factor